MTTKVRDDVYARCAAYLGRPGLAGRRSVVIETLRGGLPVAAVRRVAGALGLSLAELAPMLGLSVRTLARRGRGTLDGASSDRLFRITRVLARAAEALGDEARAVAWLKSPNIALGGPAPLGLLDTDIGTEEVLATLLRIEFGVVS